MGPSSQIEDVANRLGVYIEKLQEFFAARGLHFGSPEDIIPLTERLSSSGSFHEEMSSMMRVVIFSENEGVTQAELLELLAVSVGGPGFDVTAPEFQRPVRQLLAFVGWVIRSLWKKFPDEIVSPAEIPAEPAAVESRRQDVPTVAAPSAEAASFAHSATRLLEEVRVADPVNSRATFNSHPAPEPAAGPSVNPVARVRELWREPSSPHHKELSYPQYQSIGLFAPKYRPFWIVGLCSLVLGVALGFWLRDRPPLPSTPVRQSAQALDPAFPSMTRPRTDEALPSDSATDSVLAPLPALPKPSPYGVPLDLPPQTRKAAATPRISDARAASRDDRDLNRIYTESPNRQQAAVSPQADVQRETDGTQARVAVSPARAAWSGPQSRAETPSTVPPEHVIHLMPASPEPPRSEVAENMRPDEVSRAQPQQAYPRQSVFLSASGVMAGNLLAAPSPGYPEAVSAAGVQGKVVVQAVVGPDGSVVATRILSGPAALREAALSAVRRWRYRPYVVDGRPTAVATNATLDFRLYR